MITPNTIVKLYTGIPCDPTYQNVLHFDSLAEQIEYFSNILPVATYTDFNFIDNTKALRVKRNIENCYNINYVAYQNKIQTIEGKFYPEGISGKHVQDFYENNGYSVDMWEKEIYKRLSQEKIVNNIQPTIRDYEIEVVDIPRQYEKEEEFEMEL